MRNTEYEDYFTNDLKTVFNEIRKGRFGCVDEFNSLLDTFTHKNDYYLIGKDFPSYKKTQLQVSLFTNILIFNF